MRRREFITLVGSVSLAWPLVARAQQPDRTYRIGTLSPGRSELPDPTVNMLNTFLQGLHKLGYTEGENLACALPIQQPARGAHPNSHLHIGAL